MKKRIRVLIDKLFSRYLSTGLVLAQDVLLSFASAVLVLFFVNYVSSYSSGGATVFANWNRFVWVWLVTTTLSAALMFWIFKSYRVIIRHSSLSDMMRFLLAIVCATAIDGVVLMLTGLWHPKTWVILVAYLVLSTFLIVTFRMLLIRVYEEFQHRFRSGKTGMTRVMVYNTSEKAIALAARLHNSSRYRVVGFITPEASEDMLTTHSIPAFSFQTAQDVEYLANAHALSGIIFANEADIRKESQRLVEYAAECKLKLLVAPTIDEYNNVAAQGVRNVKVEDLLGRDEIAISMDKIKERFAGKVVMVTGASGSIGSELCRQLAKIGVKKLVLFDNAETPMHNLRLELEDKYKNLNFVPVIGDVRLKQRLDYVFRTWHPEIVFHAAAYKHVPLMEDNPCEAVLVNVIGSRNVAEKCIEYGTEMMVMISTDKAVNPTNIMGCTKRLAEIYVQSIDNPKTKFVTTRFGNVLGSNGSVIPRFREQIEHGGPVTVTHPEITRYFMTIPEACRLVMEAATLSSGKDIFVFDMGEPVKIDHLARRMIELAGFVPDDDIKIVYTGLRPGEKLYEEVLSDMENTDPTTHDRIRIAHVRNYAFKDAAAFVDELEKMARAVTIPEMVKRMKEIVPEFKSNNSKFEIYDK